MKTSYVICFVCGSKGATCSLYVKPRTKGSYFSFLENHEPPKGAKIPNSEGVVNACLVCYAFLNQQWDSFEKTKTPLVKRLYWLKRIDNQSFTGAELKVQGEYVAQIMGVQYNCGIASNVSPFEYGSHTGISCNVKNPLPSPINNSDVSPLRNERPNEVLGVLDLSVSPKKPKVTGQRSQKLEETHGRTTATSSGNRNRSNSIVCYVCAKPCPVSLARFVYAVDQSDDDGPYFPFLLELTEPSGAMPLTKNGVTQVCSECRKTLNRQWRFFDSQKVPIADRVYKIKDVPIGLGELKKETKSAESASCYVCDDLFLLNSMHALKAAGNDLNDDTQSVLKFVEKLRLERCGLQTTDNCGVLLICNPCHNHILSQWRRLNESNLSPLRPVLNGTSVEFSAPSPNDAGLSDDMKPTVQKKSTSEHSVEVGVDSVCKSDDLRDGICQSSVAESSCVTDTVMSAGCSDGAFKLPFGSSLKTDCNKNTVMKPNSKTPICDDGTLCNGRTVISQKHVPTSSAVKKLQLDCVCFLCGFKCTINGENCKFSSFTICDRPSGCTPKNGEKSGEGPFFPFLGKLSPSPGASAITADGCVDVCVLCYRNLVTQWKRYEKSDDVDDRNRWLRNYKYRSFSCNICQEIYERQNVEIVSIKEFWDLEKLNVLAVDVKADDCILVCCLCRVREKVGDRIGGKTKQTSSCLLLSRSVDKYSQNEVDSNAISKSDDDSSSHPVAADGVPFSDQQRNRSCSAVSITSPSSSSMSLSSPSSYPSKQEKPRSHAAAAEEMMNGGECEASGSERRMRKKKKTVLPQQPQEHLLAGGGPSCLEALRRMAMDSSLDSNASDEAKKFAHGEKLRNGETTGGVASVEFLKNLPSETESPAGITNDQNGFVSMQKHLPPTVDRPLTSNYASQKSEDFALAGTTLHRSIPLSSSVSSVRASPSRLLEQNGFQRSTSNLAIGNDQSTSNAGHAAFIPHPFPLIPHSAYLPDTINPMSMLNFPLSNSSFSWDDYQALQKYQSMMSSYLSYRNLFHPSLIHPMLPLKPSFVSPFFYPANSLTSASVGSSSSAFDMATSFIRRGADKNRDAEGSDSCTESTSVGSELDVCAEKTESPREFKNGGEKGKENDDKDQNADFPARVLLGEKDRPSDGSPEDRAEPEKKDSSSWVAAKHNFHRPFLENSAVEVRKNDGVAKRKRKRSERNDEETATVENSPSAEDRNCSPDSKPRKETTSLHSRQLPLENDYAVTQQMASSSRRTVDTPASNCSLMNSIPNGRNTEHQYRDERMTAAIGLISLYSANVQDSPKRSASERELCNDSSVAHSGSTESSQPVVELLPSIALETENGKRLRLDVNCSKNNSDNQIRDEDDDNGHGTVLEISPRNPTSDRLSLGVSSVSDEDFKTATFSWPGVDAIIESYQQYCQDYAMEKAFLLNQKHQTTEVRQYLLSTTEKLASKMTELTQTKKDLEGERARLQSLLDVFISCTRCLR